MNFWKAFGIEPKESDSEQRFGSLFAKLSEILGDYSDSEKQFLVGLAGLLGRVAYSDDDFPDEECDKIEEILRKQEDLSKDKREAIVSILRSLTEELVGIEDHRYTRMINAVATDEQKKEVLACLFAVAAANDSISSEEDHSIRTIAKGLLLTHQEFIAVRSKFKEHLDVLKELPGKS